MFACAMTKYQIKLVIESYRLVIEFSHVIMSSVLFFKKNMMKIKKFGRI